MSSAAGRRTLLLFDVDGTLTAPRQVIQAPMITLLKSIRTKVGVGLVGGSDLKKITEQMGSMDIMQDFDHIFSENGLVAHARGGELVHKQDISRHLGDDTLQKVINFALRYMSELELPVKRGTFVEFRSGMLNLCPVGRSCSQAERDQFAAYDAEHSVRAKFKAALEEKFSDLGLAFVIGGQISLDAFPRGWDKTYALQFVEKEYDAIHFFGDKTAPGGNDHEIYADPRVVGHAVTSPADTAVQVKKLLQID